MAGVMQEAGSAFHWQSSDFWWVRVDHLFSLCVCVFLFPFLGGGEGVLCVHYCTVSGMSILNCLFGFLYHLFTIAILFLTYNYLLAIYRPSCLIMSFDNKSRLYIDILWESVLTSL